MDVIATEGCSVGAKVGVPVAVAGKVSIGAKVGVAVSATVSVIVAAGGAVRVNVGTTIGSDVVVSGTKTDGKRVISGPIS